MSNLSTLVNRKRRCLCASVCPLRTFGSFAGAVGIKHLLFHVLNVHFPLGGDMKWKEKQNKKPGQDHEASSSLLGLHYSISSFKTVWNQTMHLPSEEVPNSVWRSGAWQWVRERFRNSAEPRCHWNQEEAVRLLGCDFLPFIELLFGSSVVTGAGSSRMSEPHCAQGWNSELGFLGIMHDAATGGLGYI